MALPSIVKKLTDRLGVARTHRVDPALQKQLTRRGISTISGDLPSAQAVRRVTQRQREEQPKSIYEMVERAKTPIDSRGIYERARAGFQEKIVRPAVGKEPEPTLPVRAEKAARKFGAGVTQTFLSSADFSVDTMQQAKAFYDKHKRKRKFETPKLGDVVTGKALEGKEQVVEVSPSLKRWHAGIAKARTAVGLGDRNKDIFDTLEKFGKELRADPAIQAGEEWEKSLREDGVLVTARRKPLETAFELGPDVLSSIAPYVIGGIGAIGRTLATKGGPILGSLVMGGAIANDLKTDAMENGMSEREATLTAIPTAAVISFMDRALGVGKQITNTMKRNLGRDMVQTVKSQADSLVARGFGAVKGALEEGLTERIQENIQIAYERRYKDVPEAEAALRRSLSTFTGIIAGGGFGVLANTLAQTTIRVAEDQIEQELKGTRDVVDITKQPAFAFQTKEQESKQTGVSTVLLEKLGERKTVSKQFISDLTNAPDMRQIEREIIREALDEMPEGKIDVQEFKSKVQTQLVPLKTKVQSGTGKQVGYESITLQPNIRGQVKDYAEHIYESPVKTKAGEIHFPGETDKYFAHARIENMADGKTRRIIEVQSDLFQKGRLDKEKTISSVDRAKDATLFDEIDLESFYEYSGWKIEKVQDLIDRKGLDGRHYDFFKNRIELREKYADRLVDLPQWQRDQYAFEEAVAEKLKNASSVRETEIEKLQPYRNTYQERIIREEIQRAAQDGKEHVLFPTGETAMKIEGLADDKNWRHVYMDEGRRISDKLEVADLAVGTNVSQAGIDWVIAETFGGGQFKAMPKEHLVSFAEGAGVEHLSDVDLISYAENHASDNFWRSAESFNISGTVDTKNPIYRFYEKTISKFLKNKYNAEPFTDERGVTWMKVGVKPEMATQPVLAFKKRPTLTEARSALIKGEVGIKRLEDYKQRLGLKFDTQLIDQILTGRLLRGGKKQEAWGVTYENKIALAEWITKWTADHEVVHYVWRNIKNIPAFNGIDRSKIYQELREKYGSELTMSELEESLAEDYELFMEDKLRTMMGEKKKHKIKGELRKFFEKLWANIMTFFESKPVEIERFYTTLSEGIAMEEQTKISKKRVPGYIQKSGVLEFKDHEGAYKRMPYEAQEFVDAKKTRREKLREYLDGEKGAEIDVQISQNREKRAGVNRAIVQGIKRNPYYRKEQSLKDDMGQGWLMGRNRGNKTQYLVSSTPTHHSMYGWVKILEVDSIAQENGFDNGTDYLEKQLELTEIPVISNPRKIADQELRKTDEEYRKAVDIVEDMRTYLKSNLISEFGELPSGELNPLETVLAQEAKLKESQQRKRLVRTVRDYFRLSDNDMRKISRKDPRYMSNEEFDEFIQFVELKAQELSERRQAISEMEVIIEKKDLKKTEQVQSFLGYPNVTEMTTKQMKEFTEFLGQFQLHDTFLTARQLETIEDTDIANAMTEREVLDVLVKKTGAPLEELKEFRPKIIDELLWDSALALKHSFYRMMVDTTNQRIAREMIEYQNHKNQVRILTKRARKSRRKADGIKLKQLVAPTDPLVFAWLDGNAEKKAELAKEMTMEEMDLAQYLQGMFEQMRNYLMANDTLEKYRTNYITHMRKSFLETVTDGGVRNAFTNLFEQQKEEQAVFNILNNVTGEILAREKFFSSALQRTGKIDPTNNVAKAATQYARAFYKKKAIDSFVGELDTYAKVLTPKEMTPQGLAMDRQLVEFTNKWLNTKKGRRAAFGFIKQGNKADTALRGLNSFISLIDLGFNPFVQAAAPAGEKSANWIMLGARQYAKGARRAQTKQGRLIGKKYEDAFVGEGFFKQLLDPVNDVGDQFSQLLFGGYIAASRSANLRFLLGMMTKQEYQAGEISPERLAELRRLMGRYRVVAGTESIYGSTSLGKAATKYLTWAIPMAANTKTNLQELGKMLKDQGPSALKTQQAQELLRVGILGGLATFMVFSKALDVEDYDEETFLHKLLRYYARDGLSVIGALDPSIYFNTPRLIRFVSDTVQAVVDVSKPFSTLEEREKGLKELKKAITPKVVKLNIKTLSGGDGVLSDKELEEKQNAILDAAIEGKMTEQQARAKFEKLMSTQDREKLREEYRGKTDEEIVNGILDAVIDGTLDEETAKKQIDLFKKIDPVKVDIASRDIMTVKNPAEFIDKLKFYAKAWKVDPITAFEATFTNERMRKIEGSTLILERIIGATESAKIKKERGYLNVKDVKLDHLVPLQLGGDNSDKNLRVITNEQWEANTPVENHLGELFRSGQMSERKAQKLIKQFKSGELTADEVLAMGS